ncbi:transposase, MuDR, MULE transposase domain protein [Tanacetum coccineum]
MNILQDVQPDAYHKLCQAGPQRWSRAHCLLVRYNYMTSNSVEFVNACTVLKRKLPVTMLAETYRTMVQDWYFKPNMTYEITDWVADKVHKRKLKSAAWIVHSVNQYQYQVSDGRYNREVNFETGTCECCKWQLSGIPCGHVIAVTRKIPRRFTTLYYTLPPNNTLSGIKAIKNDYDTNVMYDIAKVDGKLQIFVSHNPIDLRTVLIPNDGSLEESYVAKYIFPNASLAEMMNHVITDYTSKCEDDKREVTQNDYTFDQMVEWAKQEHFEDEETKEVQRQITIRKNHILNFMEDVSKHSVKS